MLSALDGSGLSKLLPGDAGQTVKPLLQQYQRFQRRKRDLVEGYAAGRLTRAGLTHAKMAVECQFQLVQAQLAELQPVGALELLPAGQTIREAWETGSLARITAKAAANAGLDGAQAPGWRAEYSAPGRLSVL